MPGRRKAAADTTIEEVRQLEIEVRQIETGGPLVPMQVPVRIAVHVVGTEFEPHFHRLGGRKAETVIGLSESGDCIGKARGGEAKCVGP